MKYITVSDCEDGHILAKDVINDRGAILVVKNTAMNNYIKDKLMDIGIRNIWIYEPLRKSTKQLEDVSLLESKENYIKNVLTIKEVINDLAAGKRMDMKKVKQISGSIYSEINKANHIVKCFGELKSTDEYTYAHSINVSFYAMLIGKWLNLSEREIKDAILAGLLHDIGKTRIPVEILNKKGRLRPEEFELIKKHTVYGYYIVKKIDELSEDIRRVVLMHHEREDKSGYPLSIKGDQINSYSKIIAVADVFDAMVSDRIYKKGVTPFEVFEMFQTVGVKGFDIKIMQIFLTNMSAYYIGSEVLMNTGAVGEIVHVPPYNITKPIVKIDATYVDLSRDDDLKISNMQ